LGRREGNGQLVIEPPIQVTHHLVFVHDQQGRAVALNQAVFLGFQSGDQGRRAEVFGEVSGGNSNIPAPGTPFGQFVVRQGPGGYGVNSLATVPTLVGPKFENEGFTRPRRGLDYDILACTQGTDGLLLPQVGYGDLVEGGQVGELEGARHNRTYSICAAGKSRKWRAVRACLRAPNPSSSSSMF